MPTPEETARIEIDRLLTAAGWLLQDKAEFNRNAGRGVAVREFGLPGGEADYLLFVDGKAAGVIEAKPAGLTLSGFAEQSERYVSPLPAGLAAHRDPLPFCYESTGIETFFRDLRDPAPRSRRLFAFHKPETLAEWLAETDTLRARLRAMPPLIETGLRGCQIEAIHGLEASLAADHPRALIQMATGAGKTFTACNFSYRLLKHAKARRILFLVDRNNLGEQTLNEFQAFHPVDDGRAFTTLYVTQHLRSNQIDRVATVVVTTIQRLYAMLQGDEAFDAAAEDVSLFEAADAGPERTVTYNPRIPIETFDLVVTDECHRSIYKTWRQVLEYFDAFIVGLTATPSKQTLGFFNQNLVTEYPYERSVADKVNVDYEIYRIKTDVGERGSRVESGYTIGYRDRRTRKERWEELDADLAYQPEALDRSVTARDQIRTVLEHYREVFSTEMFPGRKWLPKTLIFAKDDNHAEEIVHIAREVFEVGNDFAKKITYRADGKPAELLTAFRNNPMPRIAVTVDMIATGTDVKPIEVVVFMRDVRSAIYYEQMKGRGARTINATDLRQVTPDALAKTRFVLIDAVGVTESCKSDNQPLERKRNLNFKQLLDRVAAGDRDEDTLSSLGARLTALDLQIGDEDRAAISDHAAGRTLAELARRLLDAIDPDVLAAAVEKRLGPDADEAAHEALAAEMKEAAARPFDNPALRRVLIDLKTRSEIAIDEVTMDQVTYGGYDVERARGLVQRFRDFIAQNRDKLTALQILLGQPYGQRRLTYAALRELADALTRPPWHIDTVQVWQAWRRLEQARVREASPERVLTDIVQLVRFATGQIDTLEPFATVVEQRYNLWLGRQQKAGRTFSADQRAWLDLIKRHVAANAEIAREDLQDMPDFQARGGLIKARLLFGDALTSTLDDLNQTLVA